MKADNSNGADSGTLQLLEDHELFEAASSRLVKANAQALQACSEGAKKTCKEQNCSIVVQAPGQ